ncbi:MAG: class I SAM-dependent methyltransferase [Desulfobacteraceae bacterium]
MKKKTVYIQRIPGPFASLYEKASLRVRDTYYAPMAAEIASHLKDGRILDLGTGPGFLPIEIARKSSRIRIDGIDLTPSLIKMAQNHASEAGVEQRVNFEVGNASRLRWPDNTFDMVISTGMLHTLKAPVRVLRECRRVLKPGGRAWVFDPARVSSHIDKRKWKASFTFMERILYALFLLYARIHPGRVYTPEQVASMIRSAGFRGIEIQVDGKEIRAKMVKPSGS